MIPPSSRFGRYCTRETRRQHTTRYKKKTASQCHHKILRPTAGSEAVLYKVEARLLLRHRDHPTILDDCPPGDVDEVEEKLGLFKIPLHREVGCGCRSRRSEGVVEGRQHRPLRWK